MSRRGSSGNEAAYPPPPPQQQQQPLGEVDENDYATASSQLLSADNLLPATQAPPPPPTVVETPGFSESTAKFDNLYENVAASFAECQTSVQELLFIKDDILLQHLPAPLLLKLTIVIGKVFRAFSDMNTPVGEMLRLFRLYATPWEKNVSALKKLREMYETKKQMLNIAVKRLAIVDKKTKLFAREKRVMNWEKLFVKLCEAKGHGRRWKFHMETFRKQADQGYDHLLRWLMREGGDGSEMLPRKEREEDEWDVNDEGEEEEEEELGRGERPSRRQRPPIMQRGGGDMYGRGISGKRSAEDTRRALSRLSLENEDLKLDDEGLINEIDSDDEGKLLSDDREQEFERRVPAAREREQAPPPPPPKELAEAETQTSVDVENKLVWTGEPEYTRYFGVRLYKPLEFSAKKFRCKVSFGEKTFTSKHFDQASKKKDDKKSPRKSIIGRNQKKEDTVDTEAPKKVDLNNYEDFVFELKNDPLNKRFSLVEESNVRFEMKTVVESDKDVVETCMSTIPMDDVYSLDLPFINYKVLDNVQVIDFYEKPAEAAKTTQQQQQQQQQQQSVALRVKDLDSDSTTIYEMLTKRHPYTFPMFEGYSSKKGAGKTVCNLPLMFFMIRQPKVSKFDKSTGCQSLRDIVDDLTGLDFTKAGFTKMEKQQPAQQQQNEQQHHAPATSSTTGKTKQHAKETAKEKHPSAVKMETREMGTSPIPFDKSETMTKAKKEVQFSEQPQEMRELVENYQMRIEELNLNILKLEDELSQYKSLLELRASHEPSGFDDLTGGFHATIATSGPKHAKKAATRIIGFTKPEDVPPREKRQPQKIFRNQAYWPKDLPEDFLERLKLFSAKSSLHQKEIFDKYFAEESNVREQQMAVQHRLDASKASGSSTRGDGAQYDDLCLPAVFMPYKSPNNVYNPRARQYFHPTGSNNDVRITQPPSILQLPPLPSKQTASVINLFDLSTRFQAGEPDYLLKEYVNSTLTRIKEEELIRSTEDQQLLDAKDMSIAKSDQYENTSTK